MPKKTKKHKILADLRKKNQFSSPGFQFVNSQIDRIPKQPASTSQPGFIFDTKSNTKPKTGVVAHDYSYVKHDLIRITFFTIIALMIQGVLYFFLKVH
jgi:hypothetical protein